MNEAIAIDYTPGMNELEPAVDMTPSHRQPSAIPIERETDPNHTPMFGGFMVCVSALPSRLANYKKSETEGRAVAIVGDLTATFFAFEKTIRILSMPARQLFLRLCEVLTQKMGNLRIEQQHLVESDEEREERRTVYLSINDYINERGRKYATREQRKEERKILNEALKAIQHMMLDWTGKKGFDRLNIFSRQASLDGNNIRVVFNEDFCRELRRCGLMQIPTAIRTISDKRPNAFSMCMKMAHHLSMDKNITHRSKAIAEKRAVAAAHHIEYPDAEAAFELRTERLSVKTLLQHCCDLPTYKKVKKERASHKHKILVPFVENLKALQTCDPPYLQEFSFWRPKSNDRIEESEFLDMDYRDAEKCIVQFTALCDQPGAIERIARKEQRRQERITRQRRVRRRNAEQKDE